MEWERSPNSGNSNNFCNVNTNGSANNNNANNANGVAFGFCALSPGDVVRQNNPLGRNQYLTQKESLFPA